MQTRYPTTICELGREEKGTRLVGACKLAVQFFSEFVNGSGCIFLAIKVASGVHLVVQSDAAVPLILFPHDALDARLVIGALAAVHAVLGMGGCSQVLDAVVQHVTVDVIHKRNRIIAVHHPHQPVNGVELAVDFYSAIAVTIDAASRSVHLTASTTLFPIQLAVAVFKKNVCLLARQVVVARVRLICHR